jgi:hypothetical protein
VLLAVFVLLMLLSIGALLLLLAAASVSGKQLEAGIVLALAGAVMLIAISLRGCSLGGAGKAPWGLLVAWAVVFALTWQAALVLVSG